MTTSRQQHQIIRDTEQKFLVSELIVDYNRHELNSQLTFLLNSYRSRVFTLEKSWTV